MQPLCWQTYLMPSPSRVGRPAAGGSGKRSRVAAPARVYEAQQPDRAAGVGSAGQLASVSLENFMNHQNFKIELTCAPPRTQGIQTRGMVHCSVVRLRIRTENSCPSPTEGMIYHSITLRWNASMRGTTLQGIAFGVRAPKHGC